MIYKANSIAVTSDGALRQFFRLFAIPLIGAAIFSAVFAWSYGGISDALYQYRDDGIITLSHGRNWVDFGFIGVNPSGERVEATSAPLQMLLYTAAYGLTGVDYWRFIDVQTWVCTAALGALFSAFFLQRPVFALLATGLAALALSQFHSFMEWHGSGMENPITHVAMLSTVLVLATAAREKHVRAWTVLIPFLASISRVELIYYVGPLLLAFLLYWAHAVGDRQARRLLVGFGFLWLLFNAGRFFYFGSLQPNTAVAQGISVGERLVELFTVTQVFLSQSIGWSGHIFFAHGGHFLLLVIPLILFRDREDESLVILMLAGVVILAAFFAPLIFGRARLDVTRTTSHMAIFSVLAVASAAYRFQSQRIHVYLLPVFSMLFLLAYVHHASGPYFVCCDARPFDKTREELKRLADGEKIPRATVANPDLGIMSGAKQFNILDMGLLGSPIFSRLQAGPALNAYFFDYAAPDVLETHGYWTCLHKNILLDPRFRAKYQPAPGYAMAAHVCQKDAVPTGIWLRKAMLLGAQTPERRLVDDLQSRISVDRIHSEWQNCQRDNASGPAMACAYVTRTAYRFLPEFRTAGERAQLLSVFASSRTGAMDQYQLTGDLDALLHQEAIRFLMTSTGDSGALRQ